MQLDLELTVEAGGADGLAPAQARARLEETFGPLNLCRRRDPVSELVRGQIGWRTEDAVSDAVFAKLRQRFRRWEELARARPDEVLAVIAPVAFAADKAERLPRALAYIRRRTGALRLDALADGSVDEALDWLHGVPGLASEAAARVLNASTLDRAVMIVDDHVMRVAVRLGWSPPSQDGEAARTAIMEAAPDDWAGEDFLALHRRLKQLGRLLCRPDRPACDGCPLSDGCPEASVRSHGGREAPRPSLQATLRRRVRGIEREAAPRRLHGVVSLGEPALDAAFVGGGLPSGLHQIAPAEPMSVAASWLAPLAAAARSPSMGGIRLVAVQEADARREGGAPYGPGLQALGVAAAELAVVRVGHAAEALGAAEAALRLAAAPVVLLELRRGEARADLAATRRLDLLARRVGVFLFLLTPTLDATSAALTRWRVGAAASQGRRRRPGWPAVRLELLRNRAGRTGDWSLIWNPHERRFTSVAPLSAPVGAPVVDRPSAPGAERVATAA